MTQDGSMIVKMDPGLRDRLRIAGLLQEGISVTAERGPGLQQELQALEDELRGLYDGRKPSEIPGLKAARTLYKSIGVDPTRMRPASEALLRRVLKGNSVPCINSAVDAANLVSLRHLTPVGLYDCARIQGDVALRLGREGEQYQRIGSGEIHLEGRLGLFDDQGGFGNPTGDSRRTCVGSETSSLLFVAFFPADYQAEDALRMINNASEVLTQHTGGASRLLGEDGLMDW